MATKNSKDVSSERVIHDETLSKLFSCQTKSAQIRKTVLAAIRSRYSLPYTSRTGSQAHQVLIFYNFPQDLQGKCAAIPYGRCRRNGTPVCRRVCRL